MKKYNATVTFTIQAEDRRQAWQFAREFCERKMRDLATVESIHELPDPEQWIAINEPIKAQG